MTVTHQFLPATPHGVTETQPQLPEEESVWSVSNTLTFQRLSEGLVFVSCLNLSVKRNRHQVGPEHKGHQHTAQSAALQTDTRGRS